MRFFLDNCLSPVHAEALRILAHVQNNEIVHLRDKFPSDEKDVEWLSALGAEGEWIIVSGDLRISKSRAERAAWHESRLTAFFLADGFSNKGFWTQAEILVHWWPDIVLEARRNKTPGAGYLIPVKGAEFKTIYTP